MTHDEHLETRIRSEYLEMPGLTLTWPQARRLLGLDERTCHRVLNQLVATRFLRRTPNGAYVRATER